MTPAELQHFRDTASPGQVAVYFRGHYAINGGFVLREIVAAPYLSGWFDLVQRRHGRDDYSYLIIRRRTRDPEFRFWTRSKEQQGDHRFTPERSGYGCSAGYAAYGV